MNLPWQALQTNGNLFFFQFRISFRIIDRKPKNIQTEREAWIWIEVQWIPDDKISILFNLTDIRHILLFYFILIWTLCEYVVYLYTHFKNSFSLFIHRYVYRFSHIYSYFFIFFMPGWHSGWSADSVVCWLMHCRFASNQGRTSLCCLYVAVCGS